MTVPPSSASAASRSHEVRDMYAAMIQGELSGEHALAASEQMLAILLDSMTDAVFWKDLDSRFVGCNKAFSEIAGFEPALLLGKSDRDMPWATDPEFSSDWFMEWDRAVIERGESQFGILERLRRADGVETWIETNKVPLRDLNGTIIGLLGTFKDVTDVHLAQQELQQTLDDLDERVQGRTAEIERANEALRREVDDRIRSQAEERQQRTYAEALRDTAAAMSLTFDLATVADQALGGVERLVSNDLAALVLSSGDGTLNLTHHYAGFRYLTDELEVEPGSLNQLSLVRRLSTDPGPIIINDPEVSLGPARCVLGARMRVADQLVGYLIVESATLGFFTADHAERLGALADLAGAMLSNAQLAERVSELAATEERQRLARDFHDAVNQSLWTAALSAESLLSDVDETSDLYERLDRLRQLTRGALSEMRALLLELRPSELADVELGDLIKHLLHALRGRRRVDVSSELESVTVPPEAHVALYRIAQQALNNIEQHAHASSLDLQLSAGPPLVLRIADDGVGFDIDEVPSGHLGVRIMRERAETIGASFDLQSGPDGTAVTVTLTP